MSIPAFTSGGELPLGVHRAALGEVLDRFGAGSPQRMAVAERLQRVYRLARATGHLIRFVVFGSFVTDKLQPQDVDVFMVMDDAFDASALLGEAALVFDHSAADAYFGASVFWVRRLAAFGGEHAAVEYWQVKREGGRRGIVEITEEIP